MNPAGVQLVIWAQKVATEAHHQSGQMRRGRPALPYIVHPLRVSTLVAAHGGSAAAVAAAILHDVIEDTPVDGSEWPRDVLELVRAVTHTAGQTKLDAIMQLNDAPDEAVLIKLADRVDNSTAEENGMTYFSRPDVLESTRALVGIATNRGIGAGLVGVLQGLLDSQ